VTPAAETVTSSWRKTVRTTDRPVARASARPIRTAAIPPNTSEMAIATPPVRKNHGIRGTSAPIPKLAAEAPAA